MVVAVWAVPTEFLKRVETTSDTRQWQGDSYFQDIIHTEMFISTPWRCQGGPLCDIWLVRLEQTENTTCNKVLVPSLYLVPRWAETRPPAKFRGNPFGGFRVILLTKPIERPKKNAIGENITSLAAVMGCSVLMCYRPCSIMNTCNVFFSVKANICVVTRFLCNSQCTSREVTESVSWGSNVSYWAIKMFADTANHQTRLTDHCEHVNIQHFICRKRNMLFPLLKDLTLVTVIK